jgi:HlyD family secretion protein
VVSRQRSDDATAKFESDQQRVNSLEKAFQLMKLGPRQEEIARARGTLSQAQGQLDYAKSQLDATVIRAPVTGTILDRTAEKGELITAQFASAAAGGPQGSVVSLADLNDLQVELDIAQADFARLGPNKKASSPPTLIPTNKYDGEIAQISPEANRQKATVQVKVQVLNPGKYPDVQLRPEMNATVKFLANEQKCPAARSRRECCSHDCHSRSRRQESCHLIAYDGKALAREVQVLSQRSDGALVDGLVGGESVITNAPQTLKDGDKIKIKGQS